jgi:hypothetical protein
MTARHIMGWSHMATALLARVHEDEDQRRRLVASTMGIYPSRLAQIVDGRHGGVSADTVFEFGEAVATAGVPWSSGILTLALTEPFISHALGVIGRLLHGSDIDMLQAAWPAIMLAASVDHVQTRTHIEAPAMFRMRTTQQTQYAVSSAGHAALRATWRMWFGHEGDRNMPDIIVAYMALLRLHSRQETTNRHLAVALTATREGVLEMLDEYDRRYAISQHHLPFPDDREGNQKHA